MSRRIPVALTVAGSDSGGGAGIQADLKTFQELGVFGTSAITAITAQNSLGVQRIEPVAAGMVEAQMVSVLSDLGADAAKTGMLPTADIAERVAWSFRRYGVTRIVADPVHAAKDGTALSGGEAVRTMRELLFPLAEIITPNVPEAAALLGLAEKDIDTEDRMAEAAEALRSRYGSRHVLLKGGHMPGDISADVLVGAETGPMWFRAPRCATPHTHGTGCTFSSALAAGLAKGLAVPEACRLAKAFVTAAIRSSLPLGAGIGSLRHSAWREQDASQSHAGSSLLASLNDMPYNVQ